MPGHYLHHYQCERAPAQTHDHGRPTVALYLPAKDLAAQAHAQMAPSAYLLSQPHVSQPHAPQAQAAASFLSFAETAPVQAFDSATLAPHHQAWWLLDQVYRLLNPNQPVCVTAAGLQVGLGIWLIAHLKSDFECAAVFEASKQGFPFAIQPARFLWQDFPTQAMGAAILLEDWGVANRLCDPEQQRPGCYPGDLHALRQEWQPPKDWQSLDVACLLTELMGG